MGELAKRPDESGPLGDWGFGRQWREFDRLFSETMEAFARAARAAGAQLELGETLPKVDLERQGGEVVATVVVPGARPDSLEVAVSADYLTVRGEAETKQRNTHCFRAFHRTVPLPARVRPEAARTEQQGEGRLVVRVPVV